MVSRKSGRIAAVGILTLALGAAAFAQTADDQGRLRLSGLINDHTAAAPGNWELHGEWSMDVKNNSATADFSATLTMERSDAYVLTTGDTNRSAHTHHITMVNCAVTPIAGGFEVSGPANITANGSPAPLKAPLQLTVDITGGTDVAYSNIKLTFGGGAATHFGSDPLSGVVRFIHDERDQ